LKLKIDLHNDTEIYLVDNLTFYDCLIRILTTDYSQNGHSVTDMHSSENLVFISINNHSLRNRALECLLCSDTDTSLHRCYLANNIAGGGGAKFIMDIRIFHLCGCQRAVKKVYPRNTWQLVASSTLWEQLV